MDSGSIMKTSELQSDEDFDDDTIDVNQDLLYEPNQFNVPDTKNSPKPGHEDSISTRSKETQFDTIPNNEENTMVFYKKKTKKIKYFFVFFYFLFFFI